MPPNLAWAFRRVSTRIRSLLGFSLAFKAINVLLLAPLTAFVLRSCLTRWGSPSVGNFEIANFLLSSSGVLALLGVGSILLATSYFELAGLLKLLATDELPWWRALSPSTVRLHRLFELGLWQLLAYLLRLLPFLAIIGLTYGLLWRGRDINGLIILKPIEFWIGVGVAGVALAIYFAIALRLFVRWLLAVPTLLFEREVGVTQTLQLSWDRTKGQLKSWLVILATWAGSSILLTAVVAFSMQFVTKWALNQTGDSLKLAIPVTGVILAVNLLVGMSLSVLANTTFAALVLSLYRKRVGDRFLPAAELPPTSQRSVGWSLATGLVLLTTAIASNFVLLRLAGKRQEICR